MSEVYFDVIGNFISCSSCGGYFNYAITPNLIEFTPDSYGSDKYESRCPYCKRCVEVYRNE